MPQIHSLSVIVVVLASVALVGRRWAHRSPSTSQWRWWAPVHAFPLPHPHCISLGLPRGRDRGSVPPHRGVERVLLLLLVLRCETWVCAVSRKEMPACLLVCLLVM